MIISLIGFMGCGKSSVGKELKRLLSCDFVDLDEVVEGVACKTIPEIFANEGEEKFRTLESKALETLFERYNPYQDQISLVLSLGGGTLTNKDAAIQVKENCKCVYLRASIDELVANLQGTEDRRPMLAGHDLKTRVTELMSKRASTYEGLADIIVDVDGLGYIEIAEKIIEKL